MEKIKILENGKICFHIDRINDEKSVLPNSIHTFWKSVENANDIFKNEKNIHFIWKLKSSQIIKIIQRRKEKCRSCENTWSQDSGEVPNQHDAFTKQADEYSRQRTQK